MLHFQVDVQIDVQTDVQIDIQVDDRHQRRPSPARFFTRIAIPLLLLPMLASCSGSPATDRPPLSDSTFVAVLVDLHLVDADLALAADADMASSASSSVRDSVLTAHHATTDAFEKTVTWWASHPEKFLTLYEDVLERINRMSM